MHVRQHYHAGPRPRFGLPHPNGSAPQRDPPRIAAAIRTAPDAAASGSAIGKRPHSAYIAATDWRLVGMASIGAFEVKTHLSSPLDHVAQGKASPSPDTARRRRSVSPSRDATSPAPCGLD